MVKVAPGESHVVPFERGAVLVVCLRAGLSSVRISLFPSIPLPVLGHGWPSGCGLSPSLCLIDLGLSLVCRSLASSLSYPVLRRSVRYCSSSVSSFSVLPLLVHMPPRPWVIPGGACSTYVGVIQAC